MSDVVLMGNRPNWAAVDIPSPRPGLCTRSRPSTPVTYDGLYGYTYDAWNRLAKVETAYRDENDTLQTTSTVGIIEYDGLGRRTVKQIGDDCSTSCEMGDWEATYHYTYDAHKLIETRNGSDRVLKQYVWGTQYIDELLEIAVNQDPDDNCETNGGACEVYFWALHDANYNVMGLVNPFSVARPLVERYEYTPYGQRTVYSRGWLLADVDEDGDVDMEDVYRCEGSSGVNSRSDVNGDGQVDGDDNDAITAAIGHALLDDGDTQPTFYSTRGKGLDGLAPVFTTGICDVGHQGLLFDKEWGWYNNRARPYDPRMGRFPVRDLSGYADGMSLYEYLKSAPVQGADPTGLFSLKYHDRITRRAAELAIPSGVRLQRGYIGSLVDRNKMTDLDHFFDDRYHAMNIGFVSLLKEHMDTMKKVKCTTYRTPLGFASWEIEDVILAMGRILHTLQDVYAHTDWVEGRRMVPLYEQVRREDPYHGELDRLTGLWIDQGKKNPPHSRRFSLELIERGSDQEFTNTISYTYPTHGIFATDKPGHGRDRRKWRREPYRMEGAFDRAKDGATLQSVRFLVWAKKNLTKCCCEILFGRGKCKDNPESR